MNISVLTRTSTTVAVKTDQGTYALELWGDRAPTTQEQGTALFLIMGNNYYLAKPTRPTRAMKLEDLMSSAYEHAWGTTAPEKK